MTSLVDEQVERLVERAHREIDDGLLPSCQFALAADGEVLLDRTIGDAEPGSRYAIFSATKAVVAAAVWLLIQEGALDPGKRVTDYFPEFMEEGEPERRQEITVEQVMLHTSGFPHAPLGPPDWLTREGRIARMATWRLNWEPGTAYEYHPTSAHWVLAELIERLAETDYRTFVMDRVVRPHGLEPLELGVDPADQGDINELVTVGEPPDPDELEKLFGVREMPVTEVTDELLLGFNRPETRALGVPGGGAFSNAAALARFYQVLLHNPLGTWDADALADFTGNVRNVLPDPLLGHPIRRTLGLCTAGDDGFASYRGFGKTQSGASFGHDGAGGQIAWADPESGLSFVYLTNGLDANPVRMGRRGIALSSIAATTVT